MSKHFEAQTVMVIVGSAKGFAARRFDRIESSPSRLRSSRLIVLPMAEPHVVTALRAKRAEISGRVCGVGRP